ncbi:hypothetical protein ACQPZF_36165 [Actinosynnema sp. CS-041913]|uniref:hypothetical protein n=1 Tax=Actinosynnema sp. CS-041913 TaxID=3239917 RepID=UPI003D91A65B
MSIREATELNATLIALLGAAAGAVLTIMFRIIVEPYIEGKKDQRKRKDRWLEDSLKHSEDVLARMNEVRRVRTTELAFDLDKISRAILRTLTSGDGPSPLKAAAEHSNSEEVKESAAAAEKAWIVLRIATMDDEHSAEAAEEKYEPIYALQRYETALRNFAWSARRALI